MYSIKSLSKITGIPPNTLRSWERRYGIPAAQRDEAGFRSYTSEDVAYVSLIGRLVSQGHAISKLAALSEDKLRDLENTRLSSTLEDGPQVLRKRLVEAIQDRDLTRYRLLLTQALISCSPGEACGAVISPAMSEIGRRWAAGKLDIAVEHAISAITKQQLFAAVSMVQWSTSRASLAFATLPGERHELGALMAYFIASARGYQSTYFGPDLPLPSLAEAVRVVKARVLVLSVVAPDNVDEVSREVKRLAATLMPDIEIWIGSAAPLNIANSGVLLFNGFEAFDKHLIAFS